MMRSLPCVGLALSLLFALGAPVASAAPQETESKKKESKEESPAELAKKGRKLAHALAVARLEQETAEFDARIKLAAAESQAAKTSRTLDLARRELASFKDEVAPLEVTEAKIGLDRARYSAEHAKAELDELMAMYQAEEFAEMTKELVLRRGKRSLELAERAVAVQAAKIKQLTESKHRRKADELSGHVVDAEGASMRAELELQKTRIDLKLLDLKTRFGLDEAESDLKEHQDKVTKAAESAKEST